MPSPSPELHPVAAVRRLRVLLVDDDQIHLRALERQLREDEDLEVVVVQNAIDAMLSIGSKRPDLVVMDVFMPGVDGLEACRRIKSNPAIADVQVVLTSSVMTPELEEAAREAGARLAIHKPIDITALLDDLFDELVASSELLTKTQEHPPVSQVMRGADLLVKMLEEAGVEMVFGIPGGAIAPIHDALLDSSIKVVTTRHESGAMFAAAGYARATEKLGVVAVTSGPGILNSMNGLATAWCDGVPMLVLVGEIARPSHGKGVLQDGSNHGLQVVEMTRHISKFACEVPRSSALPHMLRRAVTTAMTGRRGPVVLTLPLDVTTGEVVPPRGGSDVQVRSVIEPAMIEEIASLLMRAERPLILAGCGARGQGAPERLLAVAERLSCPVVTTPKGKGVFPEDHALALGVLGVGGHRSSRRYLETGTDVVLAIGTSLGDIATEGFLQQIQAPALIHVDIDARQLGRSYSPTHTVVAPAVEFLGALSDHLATRRLRPTAVRRSTGGIVRHSLPSSAKADRLAAHEAITEIQEILPPDTIFTVDSGEHFVFATHFLEITRPDSFLVMTGLGSMGPSVGAALGAQLAHPERSVAAICGDGCFSMNAFEIATAAAERLPIRVFVFNDERLGMVEIANERIYGRTPDYALKSVDVCTLAQGLGATTLRVNRAGQLRSARDIILHNRGPVVVDIRIDPEIFIQRVERVAAMVKGVPSSSPLPAH
jgi:acetolactate synthase I/II/III large subunit